VKVNMSLREAQRRSNLLVLVGMNGDGEIAAASRGWPRNDIGKWEISAPCGCYHPGRAERVVSNYLDKYVAVIVE
jgi:hypothetical protein